MKMAVMYCAQGNFPWSDLAPWDRRLPAGLGQCMDFPLQKQRPFFDPAVWQPAVLG